MPVLQTDKISHKNPANTQTIFYLLAAMLVKKGISSYKYFDVEKNRYTQTS